MLFLSEKSEAPGIQHIEHPSDRIFDGKDAAIDALNTIKSVSNGKADLTRKIDDRVSFQAIRTPEGKVGVKYKGAGAHYNFSEKDIENQHGAKPYLVHPLKAILKHIGKVLPNREGEWQGGFMSTPESRETSNGVISHQPNTIKYSVPENSEEGKKLKRSKVSIAIHSELTGPNKTAKPVKDFSEFRQHPDVHLQSHVVSPNEKKLEKEDKSIVDEHIKAAEPLIHSKNYDHLEGHQQTARSYINSTITKSERPTVDGYVSFLRDHHQKKIDAVKMQKTKDEKAAKRDFDIAHVKNNSKSFQNTFDAHYHLQKATDHLAKGLAKTASGGYDHEIEGEKTGPEGFVSNGLKIIDRSGFSRANLLRNQNLKQKSLENLSNIKENTIVRFKQFIKESSSQSHHIVFGRMNPITKGHEAVIGQVLNDAKKENAGHTIILSGSQDSKKNPLTSEQKLKHAKRAFPNVNFSVADKESPTVLHHLSKLYKKGVRNLTMHAGSDRVEQYKDLINKYNGQESKHGFYKFDNIKIKPVGSERSDDGEGVSSASGTSMRKFASSGDKESFRKMAPSSMSNSEKDEMYNDVRSGLKIKD